MKTYLFVLTLLLFVLVGADAFASQEVQDVAPLFQLYAEKKWIALVAAGIYLAVRFLKSDTKIPIDIPPRLRFLAAVALGGAAGALEKLVNTNVSWQVALQDGLAGAGLAIFFHLLVVDSARGGKEIPIPGLIVPGEAPAPNKPITIPPAAPKDDSGRPST